MTGARPARPTRTARIALAPAALVVVAGAVAGVTALPPSPAAAAGRPAGYAAAAGGLAPARAPIGPAVGHQAVAAPPRTTTAAGDERAGLTMPYWAVAAVLAVLLLAAAGLALLVHRRALRQLAPLREALRELEGSRSSAAAELAQARQREEQLRGAGSELQQFAYVASHDLREPLRKVISFCRLLEKRYGDRLDERGLQYIAYAVDGAKRMQVLLGDLLAFARSGRPDEGDVVVALDEALDRALADLAGPIGECGAAVERPSSLPRTIGDPTLLTMLWQNLLGNAVAFRSPERAPRIAITSDGPDEDGLLAFAVTDNGIGVPPAYAEKVFGVVPRPREGAPGSNGSGIGLALSKKIVEHHGGRIWLDPAPREGTRIRFTLPAATRPAALEE
ncbi:ATP-binding protein [Streptomyces sp. NPDC088733]|uniref:sensor histidine kinase n=2 Tax=unclassified Streptomyces TaxID=2593676 RepID=UPI00381F3400